MGKDKIDEAAMKAELDAIADLFGRISSLFGPEVLQGPAGVRFGQGMQERRQDLVSLIAEVSEDVARINKSGFSYEPAVRHVASLPLVQPGAPREGGWVHIAPEAADLLRRGLWSEADGFVRHGRRIAGLFAPAGGGPSTAACERTAVWCRDQERDLRARIEYARASIPAGLNGLGGARPGAGDFRLGMVTIPDWTRFGPAERAALAGMQARRFASAFGRPAAQSRPELKAVANALRAHQNDPDYLAEFWRHVDPKQAAALAALLNKQDRDAGMDPTQVLTPESRDILAGFGVALANASKAQPRFAAPGGGTEEVSGLSPEFRANLLAAAKTNMWSTSMLFKYGPRGDHWDPALLSAMTRAVMEWRKTPAAEQPAAPAYHTPMGDFVNTQFPQNSWYVRLGLGSLPDIHKQVPGVSYDDVEKASAHNRAVQQAIAGFDPGAVVLGRTAENNDAARDVMQHGGFAGAILSADWTVPALGAAQRDIDNSGPAGALLAASVNSNRDGSAAARQAAQSVVNILAAVHSWQSQSGGKHLPAGLRSGLATVANAYIPDLANSLATPGNPGAPAATNNQVSSKGEPWQVESNNLLVRALIQEAFSDPVQLAQFRGRAQAYLVHTLRISGGSEEYRISINQAIQLMRLTDSLRGELEVTRAGQKDMEAAERKAFVNMLINYIGLVPTPPSKTLATAAKGVRTVAALGQPFIDSAYKDTDHKASAEAFVRQSDFERQQHIRALLVQALVFRGAIKPPADAGWYRDGQVIPGGRLDTWFRENAHKYHVENGDSLSKYDEFLKSSYRNAQP